MPIQGLSPRLKRKTVPACGECTDGRGSLLAASTGEGLPLGGGKRLVQLPVTPLPLLLAEQPVLAMALQGKLQYSRLGEAFAMNCMDTETQLQGLTERAVARLGDHAPAVGHHLQGPHALG